MSRSGTRYGGSISIHLLIVIQQEFLFIYFYFLVGWLGFEGGGGFGWRTVRGGAEGCVQKSVVQVLIANMYLISKLKITE